MKALCFLKSILIASFHLRPGTSNGLFHRLQVSRPKFCKHFSISPMCATCPTPLILPELVTLIIGLFCEEHRFLNFLYALFSSPLVLPLFYFRIFSSPVLISLTQSSLVFIVSKKFSQCCHVPLSTKFPTY
jgi:hypothetical protein